MGHGNGGGLMEIYDSAKTSEEIDMITAQRIRDLYGSVDEEFKSLRKAIYSVFILSNPQAVKPRERDKALETGQELLEKNKIIEGIISEGKDAKRIYR